MAAPFLFRFTHDLRLSDHAGLAAAAEHGPILPVLILDRAHEMQLVAAPRRAAAYCAAVRGLDIALRERGSRLIVRRGALGANLRHLARATGASGVAWSHGYDARALRSDQHVQSELEEAGLRAVLVHDAPAIPPDETALARADREGRGYRAFAPYFDVWRTQSVGSFEAPLLQRFASSDLQSETLPSASEFGAPECTLDAGPTAAAQALRVFLAESVIQYAVSMNVPSEDRTSHLSMHLSLGSIAARTVVRATLARADDAFLLSEERASLRLFLRALAHRDFFLQLAWFHPNLSDLPLQERMHTFTFARAHAGLDAWRNGCTGFPLVDAGIRQLHETGWMHPHVRAVAASFCCFDLGIDWRIGRDEWAKWAIDDEPAIADGNWQWIAGVGADMAQFPRIYNPERQRRRFDPSGTYVLRYVPELTHVPLTAWSGGRNARQMSFALFDDNAYPQPVVDHDQSARTFLSHYRAHVAKA